MSKPLPYSPCDPSIRDDVAPEGDAMRPWQKVLICGFVSALIVWALTGCAGQTPQQVHARLHVLWERSEPAIADLVATAHDPELSAQLEKVAQAADAVHVAFEAYIAADSAENATKLKAALAAATAAGDAIVAHFPADTDRGIRARAIANLILGFVEVAAMELPEQPAPAGDSPGDGTVP